jgi:hypothetical protein
VVTGNYLHLIFQIDGKRQYKDQSYSSSLVTFMITDCSSITFRIVLIASVRASTRRISDGVSVVLLKRHFAESFSSGSVFFRMYLVVGGIFVLLKPLPMIATKLDHTERNLIHAKPRFDLVCPVSYHHCHVVRLP